MLKLTPKDVQDEIIAGTAKRDDYLFDEAEVIARMHGPAYQRIGRAYVDHENHTFEWIALHSAKLIHSNPRIQLSAFGDERARAEAKLLEEASNQDVRQSNLRRLMQDTFPDWATYWFVTVTQSEPLPGEEDIDFPIHAAQTFSVDRRDFFLDSCAKRWGDSKIAGHRVVVSKRDLLNRAKEHPEEGWDLSAVRALRPRSNTQRESEPGAENRANSGTDRDDVEYWVVWVEQDDKQALRDAGVRKNQRRASDNGDKLFSGTILTVACETASDGSGRTGLAGQRWLRAPRPHFGVPSDDTIRGPYVMHGCYTVPRHPYPLSPILAVWHQNRELNDHVDRMIQHSRKQRSFDAVDGLNTDDSEKLKNAKDGDVLVVAGLDKERIANFKTDGLSREDLEAYGVLRRRRDEASGMPQTARGVVSGDGTATEVDRAQDASDSRADFCAQRLADGWCAVIRQRAWLLRNDYRTSLRLKSGLYLGGFDPERSIRYALGRKLIRPEEADQLLQPEALQAMQILRLPWQQLDVAIDIYSMQRTTAAMQQQRLDAGLTRVIEAAPVMPQTPFINWKEWMDKGGEALNWPDFGELVNTQLLEQYAQAMAQAAQESGGGEKAKGAIRSPQGGARAAPASEGKPKAGKDAKTGKTGNTSGAQLASSARRNR